MLDLSMTGLHRCSHIHKALGQLDAFRGRYLEQRRLQIAADLQPPPNFLEGYQAYLAQVKHWMLLGCVLLVARSAVACVHVPS